MCSAFSRSKRDGASPRVPDGGNPTHGRILFRLFFFFLALFAAAALAWMIFLPPLVTSQIRARTGFEVSVSSLSANPFTGQILVRGLAINNPPDFPVPDFLLLREFSADVDMWSLASPRVIFNEMTLDIAQVEVVRRAGGQKNSELFFQRLSGTPPPGLTPVPNRSATRATAEEPASKRYLLRKFLLRFDRLVVADYLEATPVVKNYELRLVQRYVNISDSKQLIVPEVVRSLTEANVNIHPGDFLMGDFTRAFGGFARDAAASGRELLKETGKKASEKVQGLVEKLEDSRKP